MTLERESPPALLGVNNVGLIVADLERSLAFYRDVLGLDVTLITPWIENPDMLEVRGSAGESLRFAAVRLPGMEAAINLTELRADTGASEAIPGFGLIHISLRVDDLDSWVTHCASAGFPAVAPPKVLSGPRTAKIAFLPDPDGYFVEFVQLLEP